MERIGFSIRSEENGMTVLAALKKRGCASSSLISRLKRLPDGILVNGERAYVDRVLSPGDHVSFRVNEDEPGPKAKTPLHILYEDDALLVLNKPAGLAVQPVQDSTEPTLEDQLKLHLGILSRPHPVSRLDRGTSGLMTVAKNGYMHERLKRLQGTDGYHKEYLALLAGTLPAASGEIDAPIGFTEGSTYARRVRENGAPSVTRYEALEKHGQLTLVRLIPVTGRTHQLRVHMAYIGCPLLGDWLYGERSEMIGRPALHSHYLRLRHPLTGETLEIASPLPEDMKSLI